MTAADQVRTNPVPSVGDDTLPTTPCKSAPVERATGVDAFPPIAPTPDRLVIRPGDTLIIRVAGQVSQEQASRYRQEVENRLTGIKCVVLTGVEEIAVYRP